MRERDEQKALRYESFKAVLCLDEQLPGFYNPDLMQLRYTITVSNAECGGPRKTRETRRLNRALRVQQYILAHPAMTQAIVQIVYRSTHFLVSFPEGLPAAKFKDTVEALKTALTSAGEPTFTIQLGQSTMVDHGRSSLPPGVTRRSHRCKVAKRFHLWRHLTCGALQRMEKSRSCRSLKGQTSALFSSPGMRNPQVLHTDCSIANHFQKFPMSPNSKNLCCCRSDCLSC